MSHILKERKQYSLVDTALDHPIPKENTIKNKLEPKGATLNEILYTFYKFHISPLLRVQSVFQNFYGTMIFDEFSCHR